jgi:hypothetical protein
MAVGAVVLELGEVNITGASSVLLDPKESDAGSVSFGVASWRQSTESG